VTDSLAIVITTDATGHGFVDGDNRGGAITTKMAELDELEAHGDFLIYNWPEKAFWLRLKTKSDSKESLINSDLRITGVDQLNF
jgi:hypothetical protein